MSIYSLSLSSVDDDLSLNVAFMSDSLLDHDVGDFQIF